MPCNGLAADTYDLYVLGLLEGKERAELEEHLAKGCPACLRQVRRSLDLWIVFASTLDTVEPSPEFRSRLIRIAELSKKIPVVSKRRAKEPSANAFPWALLLGAAAVASVLIVGAWYAGHRSAIIQAEQLSARLDVLSQSVSQGQLLLAQETTKRQAAEQALRSSANGAAVFEQERTRRKLEQMEAEANQYKTAILREQHSVSDDVRLVAFLSNPGIRLIKFKGVEAASSSVAYVLLSENSKLILVAANLPKLSDGKEFQLWLLRKPESGAQSAGVFSPDESNHAIVSVDDDLGAELTAIAVTDEPSGGSAAPTGTKLLIAAIEPD